MKNYKHFTPTPDTLEELKAMYRKLALKHHPDSGGSEQDMKAVNNEYDELFAKLKDIHKTKDGKTYTAKQPSSETPDQFKELIAKLMKMENIIIEIIGCFVWVTGNTQVYREPLKELNFKWHSKKTAWYLAPEDYRQRSRKNYDLNEIRNMYGTSGKMNSESEAKVNFLPKMS